jgi:hypothetical protein
MSNNLERKNKMTPLERLTKFRDALADLCEKYDITLNTETGDRIGAYPSESALECVFDFAPFASPNEIRTTEIQ